MTRPDLLKKLDGMLADAENTRLFGNIEIEIKGGIPCVVRILKTEKIGDYPNERNKPPYR
jgi:hypothetical protein